MTTDIRAVRFTIDHAHRRIMATNEDYSKFVLDEITKKETEELAKLLKETGTSWLAIRRTTSNYMNENGDVTFGVDIEFKQAIVEKIYIQIDNQGQIPKDTHYCQYCGGYTRNDQYRGNCAACGAPRIK